MNTFLERPREIPVFGEYDTVVVGGGCAGLAAAAASARNGARTLILEQFPYFGGTATASLMCNIVGIRNQVEPNDLQVMKGIGQELLLRLIECGGAEVTRNNYLSTRRSGVKDDLNYSYAFDPERFKEESLKMVRESGAEILFHAYFSDVILEENGSDEGRKRVAGIIAETKSGRCAIFGRTIIDCTGDGDVAARAGVPFIEYKKLPDGGSTGRPGLDDCLMFKVAGFGENITIGSCVCGDSMILWGPSAGWHDGTDARQLSEMEIETRLALRPLFEKLKEQHPELKDAVIAETGPLLGIRQTRFIKGEYVLTGEDVLSGASFEDGIAMGANPVIRYYGYRRFLEHEGYEIPYRCLVPVETDGLLAAGRCMSSDQIAYESWRAMAHVLCIGEAAGTAAALAVREDTDASRVNIRALREQLIAQGAEIGQGRKVVPAQDNRV